MERIEDIQYDLDYSHANILFILLHNHHLQAPPVRLQHANVLTFIQCFHDLLNCQQYVGNNTQKRITLFTTNDKFLAWNRNINTTDGSLGKICIYCDTPGGHFHMKQWNGRHHEKIQEVFMDKELDYYLLLFGLHHVRTVCKEFHKDNGLYDKFRADGKHILLALGDYFGSKATELSVEAI